MKVIDQATSLRKLASERGGRSASTAVLEPPHKSVFTTIESELSNGASDRETQKKTIKKTKREKNQNRKK